MHKTLKYIIRIAAAVFGSLAIIFAIVSWRLSNGPISIAFISPYIEEAFEAEDLSYRFKFEDTILTWAGWNRSLDILVMNAHALGPDGSVLATVPKISLELDALSLLKGKISPTSIELLRPELQLVRNLQGKLGFAITSEFEEGDVGANDLVADFLATPGTDHSLGQLKRISILGAVLSVDDKLLDMSWNAPEADLTFDLDETAIEGERFADIKIGITNAHAVGRDGNVLAAVPKISLELDALSLLKGKISPTSIELLQPELQLVRNLQGKLGFAFTSEFEQADAGANKLVSDFLAAPGTDHPLDQLRRISILGAVLSVDDKLLDMSWSAPEADLIFDLNETAIEGELFAEIEIGGVAFKVVAATALDRANGKVQTRLEFGEMVPAELAGISPKLAQLDALRLPVSGNLEFTLTRDGNLVDRVKFDLKGGEGSLHLPDVFPAPPHITSLSVRGDTDVAYSSINLDDLTIATGGPIIKFHGEIFGMPEQTGMVGNFEFTEMPFAQLGDYWPEFLMAKARSWILANVHDGVISKFSAALDIEPGEIDLVKTGRRPDSIDVNYVIRDATVNYFPGQPYIYGIDGEGHIDGSSMTLIMRDGTVEDIYAPTGVALISDFMQDSATLTIIGNLEGPAENAIRLLDRPGLKFPSALGLKADQFTGHVSTEMGVKLPFRSDVRLHEVQFAAVARLTNITVDNLFGERGVSQGNLRLMLDENSMEVGGKILVEGMPSTIKWLENFSTQAPFRSRYDVTSVLDTAAQKEFGIELGSFAEGPFDIRFSYTMSNSGSEHVTAALDARQLKMNIPELFWQKEVGDEASIFVLATLYDNEDVDIKNFEFTSKDLRIKGRASLELERGRLIEAELSNVLLGNNDVTVKYRRDDDNNIILDVGGKSLDLRPYIDQLLDSEQGNLPPFILETNVERLITRADQQITGAQARVINTSERLESAFLTGTLVTGSEFRLVLEPDGAKRRLTVRSEDAGSVARAFNIYDNAVGGNLVMDAILHDDEPGTPVRGQVLIKDYHLINAPTLAQILSIASFTGIYDALQGDGISFSSFRLPFVLNDSIVTIEDAQTAGSSIGVNAMGKVNLDTDEVDIRGTIVPAYAVNSLLGNIPLIGDLLVGGPGEGIFAATYSVTGTTTEPTITVNPLSVLAPGFLRNLFLIFDGTAQDTGEGSSPIPQDLNLDR